MEKTFIFKAKVLKFVQKSWGWKYAVQNFSTISPKLYQDGPKNTRILGVNTTITKSSTK